MSVVCVTGFFDTIPFFDSVKLKERSRISLSVQNAGDDDSASILPIIGLGKVVAIPSPDCRTLCAAGRRIEPFRIGIYDFEEGTERLLEKMSDEELYALESVWIPLSSSRSLLAGGSSVYPELLLCDLQTGSKVLSFKNPPTATFAILHEQNWNHNSIYVGGGYDGVVARYDVTQGVKVTSLRTPQRLHAQENAYSVRALGSFSSRNILVAAADDRTVSIWSRRSTMCQTTLTLPTAAYSLYCVDDKSLILVGDTNGRILVFDVRQVQKCVRDVRGSLIQTPGDNSVSEIDRIDEDLFVSCTFGGIVASWSLHSCRVVEETNLKKSCWGLSVLEGENFKDQSKSLLEERVKFILLLREQLLSFLSGWMIAVNVSRRIVLLPWSMESRN